MASSIAFLFALIVVVAAAAPASAVDYVVGDDNGWRLNVNYTTWLEGKEFHVGDRLIFKYGVGAHNVFKVDETAFQQCSVPSSGALVSGNDIITLATPGKEWYLCGIGNGFHCKAGMKLAITVVPGGPDQ